MSKIEYTTADATQPKGDGNKIIVHVCNNIGGWGRGFVLALSARWSEPKSSYQCWHAEQNEPFELGQVQFVIVDQGLWVANMIGQEGIHPKNGVPPVRYEAIKQGLGRVSTFATENSASVHMPRIGCGLAGGQWPKVEQAIAQTLIKDEIDVTVYDWNG